MSIQIPGERFGITPLPALRDNYIWGLSRQGRAALVDPGEAGPALDWLAREALALEAILISHHHHDHQGGVAGLLARYPDAQVFGSGRESITACACPLAGGERFSLLESEVAVLDVAAHTRGHLAYYVDEALFCGDTLFGGGCGKLFEGTPGDMCAALTKIAALPEKTRLFCGHEYTCFCLTFAFEKVEPRNAALKERLLRSRALRDAGRPTLPATLAEEKATNPFLRLSEPEVLRSVQTRVPTAQTPEAVLVALLDWLDEQY